MVENPIIAVADTVGTVGGIVLVPASTTKRRRLWELLEADMYTCQRRQNVACGWSGEGQRPSSFTSACYAIRLKRVPMNVAEYVNACIPTLEPFDWWWVPRSDKTGEWIEIFIREEKVLQLIKGAA